MKCFYLYKTITFVLIMENLDKLISINNWFDSPINTPLYIAGPCSAETEEQVLSTAKEISKNSKINVFRAGLWKPRTRPNTFEGVGAKGLPWLRDVKEQFGLKIAVEVAQPEHIELCLENEIDILWIGARTVSNPFSIQEIANALKDIDVPILVKNPVNPDIDLWIGAIERFYNNGVYKLAALHRGFYPFERTIFRNIPKWEIPIELKIKFPTLPVICDPSHISGTTEFIEEISQKALDLNFDGLMIESHINPKKALSDAQQQLTPSELKSLLDRLIVRDLSCEDSEFSNLLSNYRAQIDSIDFQLLELLAQRMKVVEKIGEYKSLNNVKILQLRRWENIIGTRTAYGQSRGLTEDFITKLLQLVHKESIQRQTEVMNKSKK